MTSTALMYAVHLFKGARKPTVNVPPRNIGRG